MFKQMKNIDTAFRHVRSFTMIIIAGCFLTVGFTVYQCRSLIMTVQSKVYILANGKALEVFAANRKDNVAVEARDHVKTFHQLFFTLDPDDKVIQANITKALYLADASAKKEYDDLSESGYYAGIISGNISQEIKVDSVQVNLDVTPFHFKCFATQSIIRTTSTVTRSLIAEGDLRDVARSDNNPHGFLIERWTTLENKDLKVVNKAN